MKQDSATAGRPDPVWMVGDRCRIEDLALVTGTGTRSCDYPFASDVVSRVLIYDCEAVRTAAADPETRRALMAEWAAALTSGPGVIVLRRMFAEPAIVDRVSDAFRAMIGRQHASGGGGGDHFAKPGANDRVWNALEKLCLHDPEAFCAYYGNEMLALVSEAWLGPAYQVTSQVNVVNPGGEAQSPHRDYHLGFQEAAAMERYPAHVHRFSPMLTLQGAVAHCDMPIESGPTLYLPYSQAYDPGYLAVTRPDFRAFFAENHVQLAVAKGDGVFFNPAVFHAAGHNRSRDIRRMANLLQVSSAFGRAMESIDRSRMSAALYPAMRRLLEDRRLTPVQADCAIAACAEGYPFPTNLDRDPPIGGMAPPSQQALLADALAEGWTEEKVRAELQAHAARRTA